MKSTFAIRTLLCASLGMGLVACAGGSVGTDNPGGLSLDGMTSSGDMPDSVEVRVWRKDQNPITEPDPFLDTIFATGAPIVVHPERLGLSDEVWNIEVKARDGRCALITDLSAGTNGFYKNEQAISDTLQYKLTQPGTELLIAEILDPDVPTPGEPAVGGVRDTIQLETGVNGDTSVDSLPESEVGSPDSSSPAFMVVLGTSIVIPAVGNTSPSVESLGLPPGVYTMLTVDAQGDSLATWQVTVKP